MRSIAAAGRAQPGQVELAPAMARSSRTRDSSRVRRRAARSAADARTRRMPELPRRPRPAAGREPARPPATTACAPDQRQRATAAPAAARGRRDARRHGRSLLPLGQLRRRVGCRRCGGTAGDGGGGGPSRRRLAARERVSHRKRRTAGRPAAPGRVGRPGALCPELRPSTGAPTAETASAPRRSRPSTRDTRTASGAATRP